MSARSLNKVTLIGNLTRDPELRYTPNGTAVCSFGLATNRSWTTESGERKEDAEFHKIIAWNKLGELCSQLLAKGKKVYVEGRLQTRSWVGADGQQRTTTEIVIEDMIVLDPKRLDGGNFTSAQASSMVPQMEKAPSQEAVVSATTTTSSPTVTPQPVEPAKKEEINPDDIPF